MVGAEDFTTLAATIAPGSNAKRYRIAELALRDRVPLVMLLKGAGFRSTAGHYGRSPTDLLAQAPGSGRVPTVTAVLGPSVGHGALVAPICDFTVMTRQGAIFTADRRWSKSRRERIFQRKTWAARDAIRRYLSYFSAQRLVLCSEVPPRAKPIHGRHRSCCTTSPGAMGAAALSRASHADQDLSRPATQRRAAGIVEVGRAFRLRRTYRPRLTRDALLSHCCEDQGGPA